MGRERVRVLVTGSNGLVGTKVLERLLQCAGNEPLGAYHEARGNAYLGAFPWWTLDVTDPANVAQVLDEARPEIVVHTAAFTNVDDAERQRDRAQALNADAAGHVARACAARGIRLVHLSTEYVFDGTAGPYRETDAINPQGWYAETKAAGEQQVIDAGGSWAIARTTVVYGYAPHVRANFVLWLVGKLRAGERVRIIDDQIGSPTLAENLAEMVLALAGSRETGVFHTAGADVISRLAFSRQVAATFGLDATLMDATTTAELGQLAPRPLKAGLLMDRFRLAFPTVPVLAAAEGLTVVRRQFEQAGLLG
jgi:dTDP-4-dehydrorhamnose reductase